MEPLISGHATPPRASGGDKRHARGQSTRESILRAAERLYAEHGIAAVSLRDVAAAAGQKNNGAVHYHFGGKENLVREIVLYRIETIKSASTDMFTLVLMGRQPGRVADLVRAFVIPFRSCIGNDNYYLPFLSRYISEEGGIASLMEAAASSGLEQLKSAIARAMPDCPQPAFDLRWELFGTSVIHALATYQNAWRSGTPAVPLDRLLEDLVRYHTAGLEAPWV